MPYPYSMTRQACHQYRRLRAGLRERADKVILGVRMVPTIGLYNRKTGNFNASVGGHLRITYRVVTDPTTQVVILQIHSMGPLWAHLDAIGGSPP